MNLQKISPALADTSSGLGITLQVEYTAADTNGEAELRRVFHLGMDSILAADDALNRHDAAGLDKALRALCGNAQTALRIFQQIAPGWQP